MIDVRVPVARFNSVLQRYAELSSRSMPEILTHKARDMGIKMRDALKAIIPAPGAISASVLAGAGPARGIRVRPAAVAWAARRYRAASDVATRRTRLRVRGGKNPAYAGSILRKGQRLNLQALAAARELALRERARGFVSNAAFLRLPATVQPGQQVSTRMAKGVVASKSTMTDANKTVSLLNSWGADSRFRTGQAMNTPKAQSAIRPVLALMTREMIDRIRLKLAEARSGAGL